jgi:hypothetical protein
MKLAYVDCFSGISGDNVPLKQVLSAANFHFQKLSESPK